MAHPSPPCNYRVFGLLKSGKVPTIWLEAHRKGLRGDRKIETVIKVSKEFFRLPCWRAQMSNCRICSCRRDSHGLGESEATLQKNNAEDIFFGTLQFFLQSLWSLIDARVLEVHPAVSTFAEAVTETRDPVTGRGTTSLPWFLVARKQETRGGTPDACD